MLIPQVLRTWKTRQTEDLSFATMFLFFVSCILWILYGFAKHAVPLIIANSVVGGLNLALIGLKLTNQKK